MSDSTTTDLLVIGGGPGGYAAAFRAADLGLKVTLVERDERLGGTCLLRGCIPSKALLHAAALISETRESEKFGLSFGKPTIDLDKLRGWKDGILDRLSKGLTGLSRKRRVNVITGQAAFKGSQAVEVQSKEGATAVTFDHAIVATGSRPATIPLFDIDSARVMNSTSALKLEEIPKSLLVVGGGYIGLELGSVYAELGSKVSVVEMTDGLLPGADRDLVKVLHDRLNGVFEDIHLNTSVTAIKEMQKGIKVSFEDQEGPREGTFDRLLVSVGRKPNSEGLGLENTGAELDERGFIKVDAQARTSDEHVLAVGDVAGGVGLAHKATHEGHIAAEVLAGESAAFDAQVPAVVFTDPEIAWVGLTEDEARKQNIPVEVARFPWAASGRAMTLRRTDGLTKLMVDPHTSRVLGVGIVGHGAGELIAEGALSVEMAAVAEDLAGTIHPHPTLSESLAIAAEVFLGTATDLYTGPRKRD